MPLPKREAKRMVCHDVAVILRADLGSGDEYTWHYADGSEMSPEDQFRMHAAVNELADELERRGSRCRDCAGKHPDQDAKPST